VPEIRSRLEADNNRKWKKIREYQIKHHFDPSEEVLKEQAKRYISAKIAIILYILRYYTPIYMLFGTCCYIIGYSHLWYYGYTFT